MLRTHLISAICTPLNDDQSLHTDALAAHIEAQADAGIGGLLVAGTMGLMQLQSDATYRALAERSVELNRGRLEVMVGVGDTSFARTRQRIEWVDRLDIDGVVVLTPYLFSYSQDELLDYYRAIADVSRKPVYLYTLPSLTRAEVEIETILRAAQHPNIHGVKCSTPWEWTQRLIAQIPEGFRVIPAQALRVDALVHEGVRDNLDGIFAVFPRLTASIAEAAERGDWADAAERQGVLAAMLERVRTGYPLFPSVSAILNACGIAGSIAPRPFRPLGDEVRDRLLAEPTVRAALALEAAAPSMR